MNQVKFKRDVSLSTNQTRWLAFIVGPNYAYYLGVIIHRDDAFGTIRSGYRWFQTEDEAVSHLIDLQNNSAGSFPVNTQPSLLLGPWRE